MGKAVAAQSLTENPLLRVPQPVLQKHHAAKQVPARRGGGVDGAGGIFEQGLKTGDVVPVGMGDADGVQVREGQAQNAQALSDPAAGDARVHQEASPLPGEEQRVPGGTAGQGMYRCQGGEPPLRRLPLGAVWQKLLSSSSLSVSSSASSGATESQFPLLM